MLTLYNSKTFSDIVFVVKNAVEKEEEVDVEKKIEDSCIESQLVSAATTVTTTTTKTIDNNSDFSLFAHKSIICRIPYFEALLSNDFADCKNYTEVFDDVEKKTSKIQVVDISGLLGDGTELETFKSVILFAYTGQFRENILGFFIILLSLLLLLLLLFV
jgi:hypothetical protein